MLVRVIKNVLMNGKTFSIFEGEVNIKIQSRLYKSINKSIKSIKLSKLYRSAMYLYMILTF